MWSASRWCRCSPSSRPASASASSCSCKAQGTHYDFENLVEKSQTDDWLLGMKIKPSACRLFAGDVKYHLGTSNVREFANGKSVLATLEARVVFTSEAFLKANPSHLETVNTVTLGRARAKQYYLGNTAETRSRIMPILFHGALRMHSMGSMYQDPKVLPELVPKVIYIMEYVVGTVRAKFNCLGSSLKWVSLKCESGSTQGCVLCRARRML